jgi:hypothetical protein
MLQAVYLMTSSKKGISSHQLHRTLEITYKSAWFLTHRIREAMRDGTLAPMGGAGGIIEVDETYIGKQAGHSKARGAAHKDQSTAENAKHPSLNSTLGCLKIVDTFRIVDPFRVAGYSLEALGRH